MTPQKTDYATATSVLVMDASGVPALVHRAATDAVQFYIHPLAAANSTAPHMVYRHWTDLVSRLVFGKCVSREVARQGDPDKYRELVFLDGIISLRMIDWVRRAQESDPAKAHKVARQTYARQELKQALDLFRLSPKSEELKLLETLPDGN